MTPEKDPWARATTLYGHALATFLLTVLVGVLAMRLVPLGAWSIPAYVALVWTCHAVAGRMLSRFPCPRCGGRYFSSLVAVKMPCQTCGVRWGWRPPHKKKRKRRKLPSNAEA